MVKSIIFILCLLIFQVSWGQPQPNPTPSPAPNQGGAPGETPAVPEESGEEKISEIQQYLQPFQYNREEYRDPFETQGSGSPLKPGQVYGPFLPLQTYRLSEFKLKGLMWGIKNPVAIFRAPDGEEYRLGVKDYIGENFGYVATIREKEVVIIQTIEENQKRYSTTKVVFLE